MVQIIAIAAFFVFGIAFFAIGKDDFGIKRIKEASPDSYTKGNEVVNMEKMAMNESTKNKEELSSDPLIENQSNT